MARYSQFVNRIDIDAVEQELDFEPLREENGNDIGYCILPYGLHNNGDTTGKLAIHRDKKVYNCWVCGGGSLLDLVMAVRDCGVDEATDWLFKFTGSSEENSADFVARIQKKMARPKQQPERMPYYNPNTLEKWLSSDHPWLEERKIPAETAATYKIGFNPKAIKYAPRKNGKPIDQPYESEGIILPHFWNGRLMGWQTRWLKDDRPLWCQKYTNTPDFPRKTTVFGFDQARQLVGETGKEVVVVESVPTAIYLHSLDIPAVATFGASIHQQQIRTIRSFQTGVILAPDNDAVGMEKYWGAALGLNHYVPVKWIEPADDLKPKEDLGDLDPIRTRNIVGAALTLLGKG
jgi:DNA primase